MQINNKYILYKIYLEFANKYTNIYYNNLTYINLIINRNILII